MILRVTVFQSVWTIHEDDILKKQGIYWFREELDTVILCYFNEMFIYYLYVTSGLYITPRWNQGYFLAWNPEPRFLKHGSWTTRFSSCFVRNFAPWKPMVSSWTSPGLLMAPTVAPTAVEVHAPTGVAETKEPEVFLEEWGDVENGRWFYVCILYISPYIFLYIYIYPRDPITFSEW